MQLESLEGTLGTENVWPRIAVVGAGAVGGYFGGMLARAGAPVTMIGREAFVEAIAEEGLLLESEQGKSLVRVTASTQVAAAGDADLVLFSVKTCDTLETAKTLASVLKRGAVVVSLQNGVDNVERIHQAAGIDAVAAAVYVAASVVEPGYIRKLARGDLVVGPEGRTIAEIFVRAQIPCRISENIAGELWRKLACNCALNAVSALARAPYGRIIESVEGRGLVDAIVDEVFAVARAARIVSPDFENPQTLRAAAANLAREMPTTLSSTASDLLHGKRTEIDSLNGYISQRGAELGVATPVNDTLCALVKLAEANQV